MERHLHNKIFGSTNCLSEEQLLKYNSNSLSQKEKYKVEKHLLECELCSDALEGFPSASIEEINEIRSNVQQITSQQKVLSINYWKRFLVAAILCGIAFVPVYFLFFQNKKSENILAENKKSETLETGKPEQKEISTNEIPLEETGKTEEQNKNEISAKFQIQSPKFQEKKEETISQIVADNLAESKPDGNKISDDKMNTETTAMVSDITTVSEQDESTTRNAAVEKSEPEQPIALAEKSLEKEIPANENMQGYSQPAAARMEREEEDASKNYEMKAKKKTQEFSVSGKKAPAKTLAAFDNENDLLNEGKMLFNEKKFSESLEKFNLFLSNEPENSEAKYYSGLSYYELGKTKEAKKIFEEISESKSSYKKQAKKKLEELENK